METLPNNTQKTNRTTLYPEQYLFTLNVPNTNKYTTKLTITIIQIILFEIWQSRNNNKYDKKLLSQQTIINKINAQLKTIISIHYKKQTTRHTRYIPRPILH